MRLGMRMALVILLVALLGTLAAAQTYSEVARNTGYRDGLDKGQNDARQSKSYNLERHDAYKDADHGYRSSLGSKEDYRREYREAFKQGYEQGYRGDRGRGGRRSGGTRTDPYDRPGYTSGQGGSASLETARNTGYRDGLEKGRSDAQERKSYNLERHDGFREADHGYRDSFGDREQYRREYREAFRQGYEEGYRGRPGRSGGYGRPEDRSGLPGYPYGQGGTTSYETSRNNGYRDGFEKGRNDAQDGRSYNLDRHDDYREADHGYRDSFGDREQYRREYREAFRQAYDDGYRGRGWRFGGTPPQDPTTPRYGSEPRVPVGPRSGSSDVAQNTGYRDGLEKGQNDARQGKSYNLERHDAYKEADHGYQSSIGSKEDYKQQYREAFRRGYEEGYRGVRRR